MEPKRLFRTLTVVSEPDSAPKLISLAQRMLPESGEIVVRGLVTIPEGNSLSEGALRAQRLRDAFAHAKQQFPAISGEPRVRVDYEPLDHVLDEFLDVPVDLLVVEWNGPKTTTGGIQTDVILKRAPCDVCLISAKTWDGEGPVLVALRGGPNMSLALALAKAMSPEGTVSVFHAADTNERSNDLEQLKGFVDQVRRIEQGSDIKETLLQEAQQHQAVIMGASFYRSYGHTSFVGDIVGFMYERAETPLAVVRAWQPEELSFHMPRFMRRREESLSTRVDRWFAQNSFDGDEFADLRMLMAWKEKQGVTISVGLPALNEEETVGGVIATLKKTLMDDVPLVDEIVLIDSNSIDRTVEIARQQGVPTYKHPEILPEIGSIRGKGEALWKSLYVLKGDLIAWVDTDIKNIHPRFIYGILGPLLKDPSVQYVKGFYQRPIMLGDQLQAFGGGRVTELVARPLFNLFYPELSGFVQPLAGEYAGRRKALERVPFFSGYGVETGLLIDLLGLYGLDALAQTNLQERVHHNQPLINLSKMSFAILQVFIARIENHYDVQLLDRANRSMKLIIQTPERFALDVQEIGDTERPPMVTIPAYRQRSN